MECEQCSSKAVFQKPTLCKEHFVEYFEDKVKNTIQKYELVPHQAKVAVAVSGGKDSLTTVFILKKLGYQVCGLAIDEGIEDYRSSTLHDLQSFCDTHTIPLQVVSFQDSFGLTMDEAIKIDKKKTPCHTCGVLRRYLLNKSSKDYDVIATGHNRDDEAQSIFMNFCNGTFALSSRLGPKTGVGGRKGFTQRIKPLYFCSEKEVMTYAFLKGFASKYTECPYAPQSLRFKVRSLLNTLEAKSPGIKEHLINNFLQLLPAIKKRHSTNMTIKTCMKCSEPSGNEVCKACKTRAELAST